VPPNSSVEICMSQVVREFRQGFVSHPRIGVTDNVTFDWVWADKPGTMTPAGIVTVMEPMTPPGSGLNSRFRVTTGSVEGNVVVAAKVNGVIVWSWHLWVTDYDPDTDFLTYESTGLPRIGAPDAGRAHSFMDRNLGALSNSYTLGTEDYSAFGLLYQWGRKDPLVGHTNVLRGGETTGPPIIYTPAAPEGTQIPFLTTGVTVGVRYSIEHPEAFIYLPNSYTGQWSWNDLSASSMAALWYDHTDVSHQVTKSVYDPCPAGWRLPSNGVLEGFQPSDNPEDVAKNRGHVDTPFGYIPYAGYVEWDGSVVLGVASFAFYTSQKDIPFWFSRWENGMRYVTSGGNQATKNGSNAYSVRCIKE
jgi:hypothetical protein